MRSVIFWYQTMLKFRLLKTQLVTARTRLAPFIHRPTRAFHSSLHAVTRAQFSTKTAARRGAQPPAMDSQPPDSGKPAAATSPAPEAPVHSNRRPVALPEELSRNVVYLSCESAAEGGVCDVYLVGTNHVSEESRREVQAIVNFLKPEVVFLELCSSRKAVLTLQKLKVPTAGEMIAMLKKKHNTFGVLYGWFLATIASELGVLPGSEFRVAYEEAIKYGGRAILGDRPVQLKEIDDCSCLTLVIQEMSKEFPTLVETLVHERDQYMSSHIIKSGK